MSDMQNSPMLGNTSSGVGLLGPISSLISQIQSDARNWATFGINTYNATEDRKFRNEMWDYQKQLNQTMMDREDTAVTRRAADLANAGINPLLAANWNGGAQAQAGSVINQTPTAMIPQEIQSNILGEALSKYEEQQIKREQIKSNESIAEAEHRIQESNAISNKLNAQANKLTAAVNARYTNSKNDREEKQFYQSVLNFNTEMNLQNAELEQRKAEHLSKIQNERARLEAENNWKIAENIINTAKNEIMKSATEAEWSKINNEDYINRKKVELDKMKIEMEKKMAVSSEARNWVNAVWGQTLNTVGLVLTGGFSSITHNYGDTNHYGTEYRAGTINQNSQGTFNNGK